MEHNLDIEEVLTFATDSIERHTDTSTSHQPTTLCDQPSSTNHIME